MREIKFRGKRIDNGEWVYGSLYITKPNIENKTQSYIIEPRVYLPFSSVPIDDFIEVEPETVGQFTGLKDKTGKEIYEGDIVRLPHWSPTDYQIKFIYGEFVMAWIGNESEHFKDGQYVGDIRYAEAGKIIDNIYESEKKKAIEG